MNVSARGADLFYSKRGHGPACLVLSGIGTRVYERMMPPQLSGRLTLVYVDLRGSGRSTGDPTELTFDVLAADLEAIRVDLGIERTAVLGHSILGMLAIEYGRRCPDSVSHVIVAGTPPFGDLARVSAIAASFFEEDASEDRKRVLRDNMAALAPGSSVMESVLAQTPTRFFDARFDAAPLFSDRIGNPALLMHLMGTLGPAWDVTLDPGSLRVPILIAHGRYDYTVPSALWNDVVGILPSATVRLFDESGHHPFLEEPERFTAALVEWMDRH